MSLSHSALPRLSTERREDEPTVGWLELFYDLIFVAALIEVGYVLVTDVSWAGAARFIVLFALLWWAWTGTTFYNNRVAVDDLAHRLLTIAQMFAIGTVAILVHDAFGAGAVEFALAYAAVRLTLVAMYVRAYRRIPAMRELARGYAIAFGSGAAVWIMSAFVPSPWRYALWATAIAIDVSRVFAPSLRRAVGSLPPDREHMEERYALFTIIVLGESFIKTIGAIADEGITVDTQVLGAFGLAITAALWWTYFDDVAGSPIISRPRSMMPMAVWIYGHLPLTMSLTAVGVGVEKLATTHMDEPVGRAELTLLTVALAAALISVAALDGVTRNRHFGVDERSRLVPRLTAAAALLVIAVVGAPWTALTAGIVISGIVVAQIAAEVMVAQRADRAMRRRVAGQVHPAALDEACTHLRQLGEAPPRTAGCAECLVAHTVWVHLRMCTECGHVGCCDDSEGRHAAAHHRETGHPTVRSTEIGEHWAWCFVDGVAADLDSDPDTERV
jgi:low temperature requirement protein LtrA